MEVSGLLCSFFLLISVPAFDNSIFLYLRLNRDKTLGLGTAEAYLRVSEGTFRYYSVDLHFSFDLYLSHRKLYCWSTDVVLLDRSNCEGVGC